ncbi:MAG: hypothetical protein Kow0080_35840 [Candidatus Promineifilaceae bacterium]
MNLLTQTLHPDNLRRAWEDVAENGGIPGVDNITIRRWRRSWEERLVELARAVRANQYKPTKLRRRRIPKKTPGQYRTLRIPTITDRVLQRAVLQQLYPIFEPKFLPCSCGYRPGRSLKDAVRAITHWRKQGHVWVLDADIDDFFNQVNHTLLHQFLQEDLPDQSLMPLINQWLKIGRSHPDKPVGIPMGSPLSPLLANVYLHRLDEALTGDGYILIRYADDFILLNRSRQQAEQSHKRTAEILNTLHLQLEPAKTRITSFDEGFDFIGVHFEETLYWYNWQNKRIEIHDDNTDWLFNNFGPDYT